MTFDTTHVQGALNTLRELIIRDSGIESSEDEIQLISGIKLLPKFNNTTFLFDTSGSSPNFDNVNLTLNISDIKFTHSGKSENLKDYITLAGISSFENFDLINIRESNVITTTTDQDKINLNELVIDYFKLIYFAGNAIILYNATPENQEKEGYRKVLNEYKNNIIQYTNNKSITDRTTILDGNEKNITTIKNINNNFIKEQQKYSNQLQAIKDIKNQLNSLYIYIYFVITFIFVIIILSIIFRKNNNYLIIIIFILLIINALFSKYVIITENFNTPITPIDITINCTSYINNPIIILLCKAMVGTYVKYSIITDIRAETIREIDLYTGFYNNIKSSNLNKSDKININSLTFYQYKAYTSLFLRLVILVVLLLVLYNIFGFNYIIVMLGIVLFCLILMMYLYTIKRINRNNFKIINWV